MKVSKPTIDKDLLVLEDIIDSTDDEYLESVRVLGGSFTNDRFKGISGSILERVDFTAAEAPNLDVSNTIFNGCTFTAAKFADSGWHGVMIESARCSGLQIVKGIVKDITFKDSKLELVNFRFTKFESVLFENCMLTDVDFYEATMKNVEFVNCTLNKVTFAKGKLTNVNISRSTLEHINGVSSLHGVTLSHEQLLQLAPLFAAEAGIKII